MHTNDEHATDFAPHATHPNHWARHGHPDRPCPTDGSCYGGATFKPPAATEEADRG